MSDFLTSASASTSGVLTGAYPSKYMPRVSKSLLPPPTEQEEQLRKVAQQLIGQTLVMPIMKQMRDSPFKSELFSGGRGGEAFGSMLDAKLAEKVATGGTTRLVDGIVRRFMHPAGGVSAADSVRSVQDEVQLSAGAALTDVAARSGSVPGATE